MPKCSSGWSIISCSSRIITTQALLLATQDGLSDQVIWGHIGCVDIEYLPWCIFILRLLYMLIWNVQLSLKCHFRCWKLCAKKKMFVNFYLYDVAYVCHFGFEFIDTFWGDMLFFFSHVPFSTRNSLSSVHSSVSYLCLKTQTMDVVTSLCQTHRPNIIPSGSFGASKESELGNHHVGSQVFHRHARPRPCVEMDVSLSPLVGWLVVFFLAVMFSRSILVYIHRGPWKEWWTLG